MKVRIKWVEGRTFVGGPAAVIKLVLGTATGPEGKTPGPSPMELVLIGTGGCSAYDVVHILEKGREAVEDCVVEMDADRAETEPKVFTRIHMHFIVKGRVPGTCQGQARNRSVHREILVRPPTMLSKTATVTHDFEVVDTAKL